jgi:hypothetical protein
MVSKVLYVGKEEGEDFDDDRVMYKKCAESVVVF